MNFRPLPLWLAALAWTLTPVAHADAPGDFARIGDEFGGSTLPLMTRYCLKCHSEALQEGDLDLERFSSLEKVRGDQRAWVKVAEMLDNGEMPPKEARQPSAVERARLREWVRNYLNAEAKANAGDPGRVVLRRLSNAEYTYTLRDLTGVESLDPAREFPVDGAAGEGFTNTGNALVMSPALVTKYFDAAKAVASHAVLLPDGLRFSPKTTPRDWTEETLIQIRKLYADYTDTGGGDKVNLQGIVFDTNQGGRLAVEKYLAATVEERDALATGKKDIATVARERKLNPKYLGILWANLNAKNSSPLIANLAARWRTAKPADIPALVNEVTAWQKGLWRFGTVGHIGKVGGPKAWMEPVNPVADWQEIRFAIRPTENGFETPPPKGGLGSVFSLVALDAGDGPGSDVVIWQQPRLVKAGSPDILLKDVRDVARHLMARRRTIFAATTRYLDAADEARLAKGKADVEALAKKHDVEADALAGWLGYLGISTGSVALEGHFTGVMKDGNVEGWGLSATPLIVANPHDREVRTPALLKPHSVAVHPSPTHRAAVGWRSPVTAPFQINATVTDSHVDCGNGVTWALEHRRGVTRRRLHSGATKGGELIKVGPVDRLEVEAGDVVSLVIGPKDGDHSCDTTAVSLTLTRLDGPKTVWDLVGDVSGNILAGNPHADRAGNAGVWHFYAEPDKGGGLGPVIPADSILAKWQAEKDPAARRKLAEALQMGLTTRSWSGTNSSAGVLSKLYSLGGPILGALPRVATKADSAKPEDDDADWGLDPALFGKRPDGRAIDPSVLCVQAPSAVTVRVPADLAEGYELVTTGMLDPEQGVDGSVQLEVVAGKPSKATGLTPSTANTTMVGGMWSSDNRRTSYASPFVVLENGKAKARILAAFDDFRNLFPPALCYTKIVPVDEVVTLTLYYREDDHLARLMLDDAAKAKLDRLWDELHYISHDALTLVDAFAQLMEYASQDADPKVFAPLRKPINDRAEAFRQRLVATEPKHLDALIAFAGKAYRRPLTDAETKQIRDLYATLRAEELPHDEAIRLTLARVLVSPGFLYRVEKPGPGVKPGPVSGSELASRLSYFLWASEPDDELRSVADSGKLTDPDTLAAQTTRMLRDPKTRRLATEFGCHWIHIAGFDHLDEKSERHFPSFNGLKGAMYEESIRFFADLFREDRPVLNILDADYTFLNKPLADHYGIPWDGKTPDEWRRVEGVKPFGRGGILAQATTLATQSGASRTSPTLRGNWVSEVLLGERLPRPPKGVPVLPEDEAATDGLTVRQLVEKHSENAKCAVCHRRVDPFGFALEGFDAIGRSRAKDMGGRPIDTHVKAADGAAFEGLDGLRTYLLTTRRDAFVRQFSRKLLGYALGRSVQLSDEPLMEAMRVALIDQRKGVGSAVELIVRSPQFREIRGREAAFAD